MAPEYAHSRQQRPPPAPSDRCFGSDKHRHSDNSSCHAIRSLCSVARVWVACSESRDEGQRTSDRWTRALLQCMRQNVSLLRKPVLSYNGDQTLGLVPALGRRSMPCTQTQLKRDCVRYAHAHTHTRSCLDVCVCVCVYVCVCVCVRA